MGFGRFFQVAELCLCFAFRDTAAGGRDDLV
jgi:hypothetical protein